jgi:ATP-dependent DNA ligase
MTIEFADARKWLAKTGAMLDGIVAKRRDLGHASGERTGMQKIKHFRSADCVVGGYRYGSGKKVIGSLLLGLYDAQGLLNHVGFTSAIARSDRKSITQKT